LLIVREYVPFISDPLFAGLIVELPRYLALSLNFSFNTNSMREMAKEVERFWMVHGLELVSWMEAFRIIALISPSSGPAERLISFFTSTVGEYSSLH
jgi:hypothetical protein